MKHKKSLLSILFLLLITTLSGCPVISPVTLNTQEFVDDSVLIAHVHASIAEELGVWTYSVIEVTSYMGVVQLSGFVEKPYQICLATRAAQRVYGVRMVTNCLHIRCQIGCPPPAPYDYPIAQFWGVRYD